MSDSLVTFYNQKEVRTNFNTLFKPILLTCFLQSALLERRILTRGGITLGEAITLPKENIFFGPAYN